jgi:ferric-dicitrate binding protein FerR (iron transport regulator)
MAAGRFDILFDRFRIGETTVEEIVELESLLRGDAAFRRAFATGLLLDVQLRRAFSGIVAHPVEQPPARSRFGRRVVGWSIAAAVLLGVGLSLVMVFRKTGGNQRTTVVSGEVRVRGIAVSQVSEEASFEVVGNAPSVLKLSDGSRAEFVPGTEGVIHAAPTGVRQALELKQGTGTFKVAQGKGKFQVETAVGTVSALGTEFSVKLQTRAGREERRIRVRTLMTVTVTEGAVKVETRSRTATVSAGESRVFGDRERREDERDD